MMSKLSVLSNHGKLFFKTNFLTVFLITMEVISRGTPLKCKTTFKKANARCRDIYFDLIMGGVY